MKLILPPLCVCLTCRCVLAVPFLACLEVTEQDIFLHTVTLTATGAQTKSLCAFLEEVKTDVTLETVGGCQPVVVVATRGSPMKHMLLLEANGFTLYPHQLPAASKLYIAPYEKNSMLLQALYSEGVSIIMKFSCIALYKSVS